MQARTLIPRTLIKSVIFGAAVLAIGASVQARAWTILGSGDVSCAEWLNSRALEQPILQTREAWLLGFLSGHNAAAGVDLSGDISSAALFAWIDRYCRDNQRAQLAEAAQGLIGFLRAER